MFLSLLVPTFVSTAQAEPIRISQAPTGTQPYTFLDTSYLILNHAAVYWVGESLSKNAIQNLLEFAKLKKIPRIAIYSESELPWPRLYSDQDMDYLASSRTGQNSFHFPNGRQFFVAGAYLSQCVCRMVSDVIHGTGTENSSVDVYMITDGIVDDLNYWERSKFDRSPGVPFQTVAQILQSSYNPKLRLREYVSKILYTPVSNQKEVFCPRMHSVGHAALDERFVKRQAHTVRVFLEGRKILQVGTGPKVVNLNFISSEDLNSNY